MAGSLWVDASEPPSPFHLQALAEYLSNLALQGAIRSASFAAPWRWRGRVLGFYQSSDKPEHTYRRMTGGPEAVYGEEGTYVFLVHPSTGLGETLDKAIEAAWCILEACGAGYRGFRDGRLIHEGGVGALGVTRLATRGAGPGVVEIHLPGLRCENAAKRCLSPILGQAEEEKPEWSGLDRIASSYGEPGWRAYLGTRGLAVGESRRGGYYVKVGVAVESGVIAAARLEGSFYAAPPAEPFSTLAALEGMPPTATNIDIVLSRLSTRAELAGVYLDDFKRALQEALEASGWD